MTAREGFQAALVDVVEPVLVDAGYAGSPSTWRRHNAGEDWAVVNVEAFGGEDVFHCAVNLAVVPAPWLEFMGVWLGMPPAAVQESVGLYRDRLTPEGWEIRSTEAAVEVAKDIAQRLTSHGLPLLDRLLDRDEILATVRAGDLGMLKHAQYPGLFAFAEAVLISDEGPSDRLEELLDAAREQAPGDRKEAAERYTDWIRERAKWHGDD